MIENNNYIFVIFIKKIRLLDHIIFYDEEHIKKSLFSFNSI